ncbi:hypothetical protein IDZ49_10385 [Francisella tularensis]|nr:hypothetical protein [Francisella tularensis]
MNKDRFAAQICSTIINISNFLTIQITLKNVLVKRVVLDKQRTTKEKLYMDTKPLTSEHSKINTEAIKQQAMETDDKLGEQLQQLDIQNLHVNLKQAKDIANDSKKIEKFL